MAQRICRHCQQPYIGRAGRGLCSACWRDHRHVYPPLAPFGGKAATDHWKATKVSKPGADGAAGEAAAPEDQEPTP